MNKKKLAILIIIAVVIAVAVVVAALYATGVIGGENLPTVGGWR